MRAGTTSLATPSPEPMAAVGRVGSPGFKPNKRGANEPAAEANGLCLACSDSFCWNDLNCSGAITSARVVVSFSAPTAPASPPASPPARVPGSPNLDPNNAPLPAPANPPTTEGTDLRADRPDTSRMEGV